jgi:hypothetical protein
MASYFPHTLQRMTGNSQCQPALIAEYNHFRNSIQRYSAIGDNVFCGQYSRIPPPAVSAVSG